MSSRLPVTMSSSAKVKLEFAFACSRLAARPELKLSSPTTSWPSASKRSTSVDPMNPAAPVTSARTGQPYRRGSCGRDLAELAGQRNAIDAQIVEKVAEIDHDGLWGGTGARSVPALVAWKLGASSGTAH